MDGLLAQPSPEVPVLPRRVHVADGVLAALVSAGARLAVETGGLLIGYRAEDELVVVDATGPGPNACHRRFSFNPDGCWQREQLAKIYRDTEGVLTYLGDWHTHPGGLPLPSAQDKATASAVAAAPRARTANPLTLIAGISESDVLICAYLFDGVDLVAVPVRSFASALDYVPRLPALSPDADDPGLDQALLAHASGLTSSRAVSPAVRQQRELVPVKPARRRA